MAFLDGAMEPFKIAANVYLVGMRPASCHLIATLILIDTGYMDGLHLVIHLICKLGFCPEEVKYIINTHWHCDHAEGSGAMAKLSGAKNLIECEDAGSVKRYLQPDILIHDGDTLALGNTTVHFMETTGHTKGTVSLLFDTVENGKTYRVGMLRYDCNWGKGESGCAAHPDLPIIMMSRPKVFLAEAEVERRRCVKTTYNNALAAGDINVYFLAGVALMALCGNEGTVDGWHPTDYGFASMAAALARVMEDILHKSDV